MSPPPDIDAIRVRRPGEAPCIRVTVDGVYRRQLGGKRAERAVAVVVAEYRQRDWTTGELTDERALYTACRADADRARNEARRLEEHGEGGAPFVWAVAVPVLEEPSARQGVPAMPAGSFTVEPLDEALELVNRADPSCEACAGLGFVDRDGVRLVCACVAQRRVGT